MTTTTLDWNKELTDQLDWYWRSQLRPRLEGLTDDEYLWEPVAGMWSLRRRTEAQTPMAAGAGELLLDYAYPEPAPVPVTTIAWRLAHIIVGVFAARVAGHFGGPAADYENWVYADTAAAALQQLDEQYAAWLAGIEALGEEELAEPCGPTEGPFAKHSMAGLVLHISREAIHHGAEISLLRDLYARQLTS